MTSDGDETGAADERLRIEHAVLAALSEVIDPELGIGIVDLGLVRSIRVESSRISVVLMTTTPTCPLGGLITETAAAAIGARLGSALPVLVTLDRDARWSPEMASAAVRETFARKPSRLGEALRTGASRWLGSW